VAGQGHGRSTQDAGERHQATPQSQHRGQAGRVRDQRRQHEGEGNTEGDQGGGEAGKDRAQLGERARKAAECSARIREASREPAVLDLLSRLVDRSLLEAAPSETGTMRYRLLETVRAYAAERLAAAGEDKAIRRAYAEHFCELAETTDPELRGPDQLVSLSRLRAEHGNLQAALRWAIDAGQAALAQRLVVALQWYWILHGYRIEARTWLRAAAALTGDVPVPVRAAVRTVLAWVAIDEGNVALAAAPYEAARELYHEAGERPHPVFPILDE